MRDEPNIAEPDQIDIDRDGFVKGFNNVATQINEWADRKGWNSDHPRALLAEFNIPESILEILEVHYDIMKQALIITEVSESIEARRHGHPASDKIPEFLGEEEELADEMVRTMHESRRRGLRVAEALVRKLAYNENRPFRHGKKA